MIFVEYSMKTDDSIPSEIDEGEMMSLPKTSCSDDSVSNVLISNKGNLKFGDKYRFKVFGRIKELKKMSSMNLDPKKLLATSNSSFFIDRKTSSPILIHGVNSSANKPTLEPRFLDISDHERAARKAAYGGAIQLIQCDSPVRRMEESKTTNQQTNNPSSQKLVETITFGID
jgi:hypothetical protein